MLNRASTTQLYTTFLYPKIAHYRPQTKLREGNVFTPVCSQGREGLPNRDPYRTETQPWTETSLDRETP